MKSISISVDLDSTLNNLEEHWILRDYNQEWNDNLTAEDMTVWKTDQYVKPECGKKVYEIYKRPHYFRNLGLRDQWTKEQFQWLYETFDVYVVSSCDEDTVKDKILWMRDHFPFFDTKRFIACDPKHIINTNYLIDDGPHNIEGFKQKGVLIDAAYNRYLDEKEHNFIRLKNWKDIRNYFEAVLLCENPKHEWKGIL